ncbi:MAG TPA: hypothetical protein VFQ60_04830 [Patescibacteria group bacterium]|nr:hypothetical protein [Patescibacteria group bacterium]
MDTQKIKAKITAARRLVENCISPMEMGLWASRGRYANQLWTRDFALAGAPALALLGRHDVIRAHIQQLIKRQGEDGKIPILFLDDEKAFLRDKITRSIEQGKMSFVLKRYLEDSVENLSPWTRDSEFLFVLACGEFDWENSWPLALGECCEKAIGYVLRHQSGAAGLVLGADWRDTRTDLLNDILLSNNCLWYRALSLQRIDGMARDVRQQINEWFWTGSGYRDHLGTNTADTFGQALGVLYDIFPQSRYSAVLDSFAKFDTPMGYLSNDCRPNPVTPEEKVLLESDRMKQSFVVWPFIHGYAIIALLKMGERGLAEKAFQKYTDHDGFYEWYDPETGKGYGAAEQLWSAALYLRAAHAFGYNVKK